MRTFTSVWLWLLLVVAILGAGSAVIYVQHTQTLPALHCKGFAKVSIDIEQGQLVFALSQSVQLYDKNKGLIQYEGYVKSPHDTTYLERTVYLTKGVEVNNNTYHFVIDKVTASPLNTTPDADFDQMWLENTGDNTSIDIGIRNIRDQAYVISSPYSPQFVCVAN